MLSFPALLLLVAIGALGVYLALPRGAESEHRAVRFIGLGLGLIGATFLALATAGRLPEHSGSRLSSVPSALLFYVLATASLIAAGAAVTARSAMWSIAGSGLVLLATAGLLAFLGSDGPAWLAAGLALTAGAAAVVLLLQRRPAAATLQNTTESGLGEVAREPLLACVAGACLAAGLVAVVQTAVTDELPRTIAVESNQRPASQRHRAFPRRSAIERASQAALDSQTSPAASPTFRASDVPLVSRALGLAVLLLAVGAIGALTRRNPAGMAAAWAVMIQAVALAAGAFAALHGGSAIHAVWLPLAVLPIEAGLLLLTLVAHAPRNQFGTGG